MLIWPLCICKSFFYCFWNSSEALRDVGKAKPTNFMLFSVVDQKFLFQEKSGQFTLITEITSKANNWFPTVLEDKLRRNGSHIRNMGKWPKLLAAPIIFEIALNVNIHCVIFSISFCFPPFSNSIFEIFRQNKKHHLQV